MTDINVGNLSETINDKMDRDMGNIGTVGSSTKRTIIGWGAPDYSSGVAKTTDPNTTWTAPSNGWVCMKAQIPNTTTWYYVYVNGVAVADWLAAECSYGVSVVFPVSAGDEIYHTVPSGYFRSATFFPCKGL